MTLREFFGIGKITGIDYTDGIRLTFSTGEVLHFRPSGNAPEFRVYAVADTEARAQLLGTFGKIVFLTWVEKHYHGTNHRDTD